MLTPQQRSQLTQPRVDLELKPWLGQPRQAALCALHQYDLVSIAMSHEGGRLGVCFCVWGGWPCRGGLGGSKQTVATPSTRCKEKRPPATPSSAG